MVTSVIKQCRQDRIFNIINYALLIIFFLLIIYPLIFIISCSFSSGQALLTGQVKLLPVEPSLLCYKTVFTYTPIWIGYANSLFYMIVGTCVNVVLTICAAYPLSRPELKGKKFLNWYFLFTMLFNGGLVPNYMLVKNLGLLNSRWAIVLTGALSVYNVIVARSFFKQTIPEELLEAARIDGCSYFKFITNVVIPLSKPIIAVISLWVAVGIWNSYFTPLIYLNDSSLQPLQLVLRNILLISTQVDFTKSTSNPELMQNAKYLGELLKYGSIVVASLPLMILYPFVQKYFVKGVMIGSLKG
jgi:putative aldouronate transport system permease protein